VSEFEKQAKALGVMFALDITGAYPDPFTKMVAQKQAQSTLGTVVTTPLQGADIVARSLIAMALLTGTPLGAVAHVLHKDSKNKTTKEKALENERDYLYAAAKDLEERLSRSV
jgi:hypothetical protein